MERRRSSNRGLLPAAAASLAACEALRLCGTIRTAAADVPTCRRDCRKLARFVGKVMLILEALLPAMEQEQQQEQAAAVATAAAAQLGWDLAAADAADDPTMQLNGSAGVAAAWQAAMAGPKAKQHCQPPPPQQLSPDAVMVAWAEAAADVQEALGAAAELVAACGAMGRLQAVMEAEDMRARFAAAARDLSLALSGLQALQAVVPPDVAEDVAAVQRQLGSLRFNSSSQQEQLAAALLQAVTLRYMRHPQGSSTVPPLLLEGLELAGLDPASQAWLDFEVGRLRDGARVAAQEGDPITEFFYKQVIMCLLAHLCGAWGQQQQQPRGEDGEEVSVSAGMGAAHLTHDGSSGGSLSGVGTPSVAASTPQKCVSSSSSSLPGVLTDDEAAAGLAGQQQHGALASRLQQLMNAWSSSNGSSAQPSPGGSSPQQQQQQLQQLLLPVSSISMPDSPLSEDTLSSLLGAFQPEATDPLRTIDPADLVTVVSALRSTSELTQFVAVVLIERLVEGGSDADKAELARLGVVGKLVRVLQLSHQPLLRAVVATACRHLARDVAVRQQLAAAGAISALSLLLQSRNSSARQAAARAISNLVVNCEANKIEAAKFGTIHSLAKMLGEADGPLLQESAAAALANLAANSSEAQCLVASAGAIPLLVEVLRSGTAAAKQHSARAIRNLAGRDVQNKLKTAEAGAIPLLVGLMAGGCTEGCDDEASRQAAGSALSNIACNCEQTQKQIVAEGALPVIADMLLPASGCATACREAAAWLLSNLACSADVRGMLGKESGLLLGVVSGLLDLLRSGSDSAAQAAARAIKNLSAGHSNVNKVHIAEAGAVPLLVRLLRSPTDATRKSAASALWNLAYRNNPNRKAIVRAGAIPLLVKLLGAGNSEGTRQEAARAMSNLSCNNDVNQGCQMVAEGAVPLLVSMMKSSGPAGKEAAVGAISNLACIRTHQQAILKAGAAPLLLQLMQPGASSGCQEAAARGFGNLVCDSLNDVLRPSAYQAVPLLVGIMGGGGDGARQAAARAISNLVCSDVTLQVLVAKSGAAPALVELCKCPNEELREAAAVALWDLAYDSSLGREAIARAGAVPWLAQLLLFGGSGAKEAAAACLAELAAVGPVVQQEIREAGAVKLLQGLQNSNVPEVALAATEALRSLEVNSSKSSSRASSSEAAVAAPARPAVLAGIANSGGSARPFSTSGSWGRRVVQSVQLEQDPPEVTAAAAAAAAAAAVAAVGSPPKHPPPLPRPPPSSSRPAVPPSPFVTPPGAAT